MLVHRAWEVRDEQGRTRRVFPLSEYRGATSGEKAKNTFTDAKNQSAPSATIVPLYSNDGERSLEERTADAAVALAASMDDGHTEPMYLARIALRAARVEG
jgi:hypothetical protein